MFLMYFSATKYIIMCKDTFLFGISVRYVALFSFSVHAVAVASAPQSLSHRNGMTFSLHRVAFPRHSFCRHNTTALILQCQAYNTPVPKLWYSSTTLYGTFVVLRTGYNFIWMRR
jgi:hypothetical protein